MSAYTLHLTGEEAEIVAQALNAYRGPRLAHVLWHDANGVALTAAAGDELERWRTEAAIATDVIGRLR